MFKPLIRVFTLFSITVLISSFSFKSHAQGYWECLGMSDLNQPSHFQANEVDLVVGEDGTQYIAFSDAGHEGKITVRKYQNGNWSFVGSAGFSSGEVRDISLQKAPDGTLYVGYEETTWPPYVVVKRYVNNDWEVVGTEGFLNGQSDDMILRLDGSGVPYVAYKDSDNGNGPSVRKFDGNNWIPVGALGFVQELLYAIDLTFDNNDKPTVAINNYVNQNPQVRGFQFDGLSWNQIGSFFISHFSSDNDVAIAIDEENQPIIVAEDTASGPNGGYQIIVRRYDGSEWVQMGSHLPYSHPDDLQIEVSPSGTKYLAVSKYVPYLFKYEGTDWVSMELEGGWPPSDNGIGLDLGPSNLPVVAIVSSGNGYKINVTRYDGAQWTYSGNYGFSEGRADNTAIAIDNFNVPFICYRDRDIGYGVGVKRFLNGAWHPVGVQPFTSSNSGYSRIEMLDDLPWVVYMEDWGGFSRKAMVQRFNGSEWVHVGSSEGLSNDWAFDTDITFSPTGVPYICFKDYAAAVKATVMSYNGSEWLTVGQPGFSPLIAHHTRIVTDSEGTPYVSFCGDGEYAFGVTVMKYAGDQWVLVGEQEFSGGHAQFADIAIGDDDQPIVVYSDGTVQGKTSVMKFNGTEWEYVGDAGISTGEAFSTSIQVDSQGDILVAFSDWALSSRGVVKKFFNNEWVDVSSELPTIGLAHETELAIGPDDTPFLAVSSGRAWCYKLNCANVGVSQDGLIFTSLAADASYQWLDCNNGMEPIFGATMQSFEGEVGGSYAVEVTQNTCVDTSICYNTAVGIQKTENQNLLVFPNPTSGNFTLAIPNSGNWTITMYDGTGRMMYKESVQTGRSEHSIHLNETFPDGLYSIQASNESGRQLHSRLIIQR